MGTIGRLIFVIILTCTNATYIEATFQPRKSSGSTVYWWSNQVWEDTKDEAKIESDLYIAADSFRRSLLAMPEWSRRRESNKDGAVSAMVYKGRKDLVVASNSIGSGTVRSYGPPRPKQENLYPAHSTHAEQNCLAVWMHLTSVDPEVLGGFVVTLGLNGKVMSACRGHRYYNGCEDLLNRNRIKDVGKSAEAVMDRLKEERSKEELKRMERMQKDSDSGVLWRDKFLNRKEQ